MSDEPIVLVQGADSATALIRRYGQSRIKRWVAYDALAQQILHDHRIPFVDESYYLKSEVSVLKSLPGEASRLAEHWYRGLPPVYPLENSRFRIEDFYSKSFNSYFLSMLCAYHFLVRIREIEGPCHLATTRYGMDSHSRSHRFRRKESPVPLLLETFGSQWGFKLIYESLDEPASPKKKTSQLVDLTCRVGAFVSRKMSRGKILFSGNPMLLGPVERELKARYQLDSLYARPFKRIRDLIHIPKGRLLIPVPEQGGPSRNFDHRKIHEVLKRDHRISSDQNDFLPFVWEKIEAFYKEEALWADKVFREIKVALQALRPLYVICDEDVIEFNRMLVLAANEMGIPTLVVAHGLPGSPSGYLPLASRHVAVWGNYMSEVLNSWGLSSDRMVLTGCPKYDSLTPEMNLREHKKTVCERFQWNPDQPMTVIIPGKFHADPFIRFDGSGCTSTEALKTAHHFVRVAGKVRGVNLIYKFRADSQENQVFKKLIQRSISPNIKFVHEGLALDYIKASDVVFNNCSSAGLEAILLKKPVINMNFSFHENIFPFFSYGLGASVTTFEGTLAICQRLAEGSLPLKEWVVSQENLVGPFLFSRDGQAASRIASFVWENLRQSSKSPLPYESPLDIGLPIAR